jgi:hypothetical protein
MARFHGKAEYDDYDEVSINLEQWATIQSAGKIALEPEDRRQVESHLRTFVRRTRAPATPTTLSEVLPLLEAVENDAKILRNALADMCPGNRSNQVASEVARRAFQMVLHRVVGTDGWAFGTPVFPSGRLDAVLWLEHVERELDVLIKVARGAQDCARQLYFSGHPNDELRDLLDLVAPVYERCGGRVSANKDEGAWSPFVRWVSELMKCVPPSLVKPKSIDALGEAIRQWRFKRSRDRPQEN